MEKGEREMMKQMAAEARAARHKEDARLNKNVTLAMIIGLCASPFAFHAIFDTGLYTSAFLGLGVAIPTNTTLK